MAKPTIRQMIRALKEGPDFGIHGTRRSFWYGGPCESARERLLGHYFSYEGDERAESEEVFASRLRASISCAMYFSAPKQTSLYKIENGKAVFSSTPFLIMAVDSEDAGRIRGDTDRRFGTLDDRETFKVGHDPVYVDLYPLSIRPPEIGIINAKLKEKTFDNMARSYFVLEELTSRFIRKMFYETIFYPAREHQRSILSQGQ